MNLTALHQLVQQKYINVQKHPAAELYIYNYSQTAQYERLWNETTLMCRGLILNQNDEIVARPFPKFFNYEELDSSQIPNEPFEVYEKMDGSLGILYWLDNQPFIASRGSFASEQAIWASELLHQKYAHTFDKLDKNHTYLFEIIYPSNRIVVDYGETKDLILLTIIETTTGRDIELNDDLGFKIVRKFDGLTDYQQIKSYPTTNFEGFVLKFQSGFRLKVKLEEYIRLHRIITNISTTDIWECLAENKSFDAFLENVPDEFYDWVKATKADLEANYKAIEDECKGVYREFEDRKTAAEYNQKQQYPMILFKMMDNRKYDYIIWKLIKPAFQKAFKSKNDFVD
jgi:RNA ligase